MITFTPEEKLLIPKKYLIAVTLTEYNKDSFYKPNTASIRMTFSAPGLYNADLKKWNELRPSRKPDGVKPKFFSEESNVVINSFDFLLTASSNVLSLVLEFSKDSIEYKELIEELMNDIVGDYEISERKNLYLKAVYFTK